MDALEAEHEALQLYAAHYQQFYNCCIEHAARVSNSRESRQQLIDEMIGRVFDVLPEICARYDPNHPAARPLIQWAMFNVRLYLRKFREFSREHYSGAIVEQSERLSLDERIIAEEMVCIVKGTLSAQEFKILWLCDAEGLTIEQVAHALHLSVSHVYRMLQRIERKLHRMVETGALKYGD